MAYFLSPSQITCYATQLRSELIALRRRLHQYPELSWEEEQTAKVIAEHLKSLGLTFQRDMGGHGLIAQITGQLPGPTIAYRADMDALPIQDALQAVYRSTALGISHACGHDAHMTIAVGVAKTLNAFRDNLHGTIRFLFQPAEEALDGAHAMIACGALDDPTPRAVLALHAFPLPVGSIGITPGICLAGMDEFQVKFCAPDAVLPNLIDMAISALVAISNQTPPATSQDFDFLIQRMIAGDNLKDSLYLSCWQNTGDSGSDAHISGLVSMTDYAARLDVQHRIKQT
ncbi:MAG: amidohydrolase, partial [Anaerolineales bacterium]